MQNTDFTEKRKRFPAELSYIFGMFSLAFGCAFMERANFGLSMVVAPAYILYVKLSAYFSFLTFGMAEYVFQAFLLIIMILVLKRFRISYVFSFASAVLYGFLLDFAMTAVSYIPKEPIASRIPMYIVGLLLCSLGVAFMIHTYIPGEVYELICKEVPSRFNIGISKFKTAYDISSCIIAVIMSFAFFGMWHFEGVKLGTVICALVNGFFIGKISSFMDRHFVFAPYIHMGTNNQKQTFDDKQSTTFNQNAK